jgi:hypothetical protein
MWKSIIIYVINRVKIYAKQLKLFIKIVLLSSKINLMFNFINKIIHMSNLRFKNLILMKKRHQMYKKFVYLTKK